MDYDLLLFGRVLKDGLAVKVAWSPGGSLILQGLTPIEIAVTSQR